MNMIQTMIWTVCVIQKNDEILLIDRKHGNFQGFIPPGGKVEHPESIVEGAIREVWEETGLKVDNLVFKGIYEWVNEDKNSRFLIFNYWTDTFAGELLENPPEGELKWISVNEIENLPMQESVKERMPYFFEKGTFDMHNYVEDGKQVRHTKRT